MITFSCCNLHSGLQLHFRWVYHPDTELYVSEITGIQWHPYYPFLIYRDEKDGFIRQNLFDAFSEHFPVDTYLKGLIGNGKVPKNALSLLQNAKTKLTHNPHLVEQGHVFSHINRWLEAKIMELQAC